MKAKEQKWLACFVFNLKKPPPTAMNEQSQAKPSQNKL